MRATGLVGRMAASYKSLAFCRVVAFCNAG
jgi:hypothetical protein